MLNFKPLSKTAVLCVLVSLAPFAGIGLAEELNSNIKIDLKQLKPVEAFNHMREKIESSKSIKEFAPFVTSDLSRLLLSIEETGQEYQQEGLEQAKKLTMVYPGEVFVSNCNIDLTRKTATLLVFPTVIERNNQKLDKEACTVVMQQENSIWKFKNAKYEKLDPWYFYAVDRDPPDVPLTVMISGKKFYPSNIEYRGSGIEFHLNSPHSHDEYKVEITAEELGELIRSIKQRALKGKPPEKIIFKRPLSKQKFNWRKIAPLITIKKNGVDLPYLKCSRGFGMTLSFLDYETYEELDASDPRYKRKVAVFTGSIFLRLPDRYKSFMEGHFKAKIR